MKPIRLITGFIASSMLLTVAIPAQSPSGGAISLKAVKYAGLAETVTKHRGKVVVVDLWGFF